MEAEKRSLKTELDGLRRKLSSGTEQRENLLQIAAQFRSRAVADVTLAQKLLILQAFQVRVVADGREGWELNFGERK